MKSAVSSLEMDLKITRAQIQTETDPDDLKRLQQKERELSQAITILRTVTTAASIVRENLARKIATTEVTEGGA